MVYLSVWAVVLVAVFTPQPPTGLEHGVDKLGHLLALFAVGYSGCFAVFPGLCPKRYWIWTALAAIALECLQGALLVEREFSLLDMAANVAGVGLAVLLWRLGPRPRLAASR